MNPFITIATIAIAAILAAAGSVLVPGWVADAEDAKATNDLLNIANAQRAAQTTTGQFATDLDELEDGAGGVKYQAREDVTTELFASADAWCAVSLSSTGTYFARTSDSPKTFEGETDIDALDAAACNVEG